MQNTRPSRSKTKHSTVNMDPIVESTSSDAMYNKLHKDIEETSEATVKITKQSESEELGHLFSSRAVVADSDSVAEPVVAPATNCTYTDHVVDKKMIDIDNNNEKHIDHGKQAGL